jgi:hypothetical protein
MSLFGLSDSERRKLAAWLGAVEIPGFDSSRFRKDRFGFWIAWAEYGRCTMYGWEIDHVLPVSRGGIDHESNCAATHWSANRAKSNFFAG